MLENLIPARRAFQAADPIFTLDAEARSRAAAGEDVLNATVGVLADDAGRTVLLETVRDLWRDLPPEEALPYAPITGEPEFLDALVRRHWPGLADRGAGCATPGGTGALAMSVRNLLEPGMAVLAAGPCWGPYAAIAAEQGAGLELAPHPGPGAGLDGDAWERAGARLLDRQGRLLVWLNDPCHNPTGHSLGAADRECLGAVLERLAGRGPVTLLLDCAYPDYAADPGQVRAALDFYAGLGRSGRVLVGAALSLSKALTLYGGRIGALVFPWARDAALQGALAFSCRGAFATSPRAGQALLVRLDRDPARQGRLGAEHRHWSGVLAGRARALDRALRAAGRPGVAWSGGFFLAFQADDPPALAAGLRDRGVYVVPVQGGVRVGLCALPEHRAPRFAQALADCLDR